MGERNPVHLFSVFSVVILFSVGTALAQPAHPLLLLNSHDVAEIRENLGKAPLFDAVFQQAKETVEHALATPMDVPVPKDAGGYTHERHKQNYTEMQLAGILYAVTKDERYARFIREMLLRYAGLYPTLGEHPAKAGESAGRLFWQTLNETVWLVHASQAYDCIYDWLSPADRKKIEENIFRPMTKFFITEHREEHDRIHNHGTWMVTAVGMAGYVMHDKDLVQQALYGTHKDGKGGFLKQLDSLFSPDGFYTEGLYYVRYAIMPFIVFGQVIENNQPDMKIFEYRKQILKKALYAALQLTNVNGAFFPINDALKEKSYRSPEVILALDIVYQRYGNDPTLLSIAKNQGAVTLLGAGYEVAAALEKGLAKPFPYASVEFSDGPNGDGGAFGVLRSGPPDDQLVVAMKYTGHGLSHGHYDKLEIFGYDAGQEILQDYGSARFINVESKYGGRYLPENKSWAMQTIAHNTVTVDGISQYEGKQSISERYHADKQFFSAEDPALQVMSATCLNAYKGISMQRTVSMVTDPVNSKPVLIDVFRVAADREHQYDLPFYYEGQFLSSSVSYTPFASAQKPLGTKNGYQHLWLEAEGKATIPANFSWLQTKGPLEIGRYYTLTTASDSSMKVCFVRIGANDPNFNLRKEGGVILRTKGKEYVFASVIEPHGLWDGNTEVSRDANGNVKSVTVLGSNDQGSVVEIAWKDGRKWEWMVSTGKSSTTAHHEVLTKDGKKEWTGDFILEKK
ncbi:MAG: heparinase II/III family protein [Bacteroidota bacterium]